MSKRYLRFSIAVAFLAALYCVVIASCNDESDSDAGVSNADEAEYDDSAPVDAVQDALSHVGVGADVQTPITYAGTVIDPRDNVAVADAQIQVTFADGTDAGYSVIYSDEDGKFEFIGDEDYDYKISVEKAHYIATELWTMRSACGNLEEGLPTVWLVPQPVITEGAIAGVITDALNGWTIALADIEFRKGLNAPDEGSVLYTSVTNSNAPMGKYEVSAMEAGVYTGHITKESSDYLPSTVLVYALGGRSVNGQHGAMITQLGQSQMRIVVTWGVNPSDLDSHLWAPHNGCESDNPFHLYFPDAEDYGGQGCSNYFRLDLDDTTSNGPETTTIWDATGVLNETYSFLVHDYTNRSCAGSCLAMCNSPGFKVDVYAGECVQSFYPIPGTDATVWHVFDAAYDGSEWVIAAADEYCHESEPSAVGPTCY